MHLPESLDDATLQQLVLHIAGQARRRWLADLEPYGLSPHLARALGVVARRADAPPRLADLAEWLRISPRSATEVVDGLAERGLVRREPSPTDRRATVVVLTDAGRDLWQQVRTARSTDDSVFDVLSAADRAALRRLLTTVAAAIDRTDR